MYDYAKCMSQFRANVCVLVHSKQLCTCAHTLCGGSNLHVNTTLEPQRMCRVCVSFAAIHYMQMNTPEHDAFRHSHRPEASQTAQTHHHIVDGTRMSGWSNHEHGTHTQKPSAGTAAVCSCWCFGCCCCCDVCISLGCAVHPTYNRQCMCDASRTVGMITQSTSRSLAHSHRASNISAMVMLICACVRQVRLMMGRLCGEFGVTGYACGMPLRTTDTTGMPRVLACREKSASHSGGKLMVVVISNFDNHHSEAPLSQTCTLAKCP